MREFENHDLNPGEGSGLDYGSDSRFFAAAGGIVEEPYKFPRQEDAPQDEEVRPAVDDASEPPMEDDAEPQAQIPTEDGAEAQAPVTAVPLAQESDFSQTAAFDDTDGAYHAEGVGRREYAHDVTAPEPIPVRPEPPRKAEKKIRKKKKHSMAAVAAVAVVCALVGGLGGGAAVGFYMHRQNQESVSQLQSQIDALKTQGTGSHLIVNSASTPIVNNVSENGLLNPAQVYEQNAKSAVYVLNKGVQASGWGMTEFTGSGSGFILTQDGYILTNYHVIENYRSITVTDYQGNEYDATVVGYDALSDVALLKVDAKDLPAVTVGDSDVLAVGDQVVAIGNPLGELTSTQTVGYVSAKDRMVNTDGTILNMIQTDAAINSGNSGGPLFNMYGQVIGITTAKYSGSSSSGASIEGIGFAIPINSVMELVDDLMEYGYVTGQAYLGVTLQNMDASVAAAYGLPSGPKVLEVTEGSCAEKAGIQPQDIIVGLGDQEITSYSDLAYALRSYRAGDSTTITVYRAGQELTLDVTFDEKPANTNASQTQPTEENSGNGFGNWLPGNP